ncbi:hypothetical protein [Leptospira perdikensis]|uniref:DUF4345 domain-containing protein n=1 Tax=Leptospira perdikensis TaxID=2484948 RepID=A0A4R9JJ95_9LEPT|nr:hypothetical protein [Leptospira perdikensis]TGL45046.1 hypothetical protein EHQ49_06195 [Leptospira perdikensis]
MRLLNPAFTVFIFGVYLLGQGFALLFFPNVLLSIFQIPIPLDYWIKIVGIALIILGFYYIGTAKFNLILFFQLTVIGRSLQFVLFLILYFIQPIPVMLLGFSFFEFLSGIWTYIALKKNK